LPILLLILEVTFFSKENKRGEFTIQQRKKKREIIEEQDNQVNVTPDVGDQPKKALDQTS
jgi:hypothetical protein